jgi:lysophospholipase L1-like esterase
MKRSTAPGALFLLATWMAPPAAAAPQDAREEFGPYLKAGARLAILGDSITEQRLYCRNIASYLAACHPDLDAHVMQFGWSGETAAGCLARLENDILPFKPTVATTCYGMNDGGYAPFNSETGERYEKPMRAIVGKLKSAGAIVLVGSPGAVDRYFFRRGQDGEKAAAMYNETLGKLRDIARKTAKSDDFPFADVHQTMWCAATKAQNALGKEYHVCGGDGFHPAPNGQLLMAYAFLKGLGVGGDLGVIEVDMKGTATARGGHQVESFAGGAATITSRRIPFAPTGDAKSPNGTRSILPFVPFMQNLCRLTLKVTNASSDRLTVKWGNESKTFAKADLEKGINLAAEFSETPLAPAFRRIDAAVGAQQEFQTYMIKSVITHHRALKGPLGSDPEVASATATIAKKLWEREAELQSKVRAAIAPAKHVITVTAAN